MRKQLAEDKRREIEEARKREEERLDDLRKLEEEVCLCLFVFFAMKKKEKERKLKK